MVKKKLLALGVSVAAVTAVAGAGFAAWVKFFSLSINTFSSLSLISLYRVPCKQS